MSLFFNEKTGDPVHLPKRRDVFEFDDEVAQIFDNMAVRSIPLYAEVHRMQAAILKHMIDRHKATAPFVIVDVGASLGMSFRMLCHTYGVDIEEGLPADKVHCIAIDKSKSMTSRLSKIMPWVEVRTADPTSFSSKALPECNAILMNWVLQFIGPSRRPRLIAMSYESLCNGGLIFTSQKESQSKMHGSKISATVMQEEYIRFRRDNGYSDKEIEAKTRALKKVMQPMTRASLYSMLYSAGFDRGEDIMRWGQFSSSVFYKINRKG